MPQENMKLETLALRRKAPDKHQFPQRKRTNLRQNSFKTHHLKHTLCQPGPLFPRSLFLFVPFFPVCFESCFMLFRMRKRTHSQNEALNMPKQNLNQRSKDDQTITENFPRLNFQNQNCANLTVKYQHVYGTVPKKNTLLSK